MKSKSNASADNLTPPACKECIYLVGKICYHKDLLVYDLDKVQFKIGGKAYFAHYNRLNVNRCGPEGKYYKGKNL